MQSRFYGRMNANKPSIAVPITTTCSKCGGLFSVEKKHHEVSSFPSVYKKDTKGILDKVLLAPEVTYTLCPGCFEKLKIWMARL